ncbi:MAG: AAA family ATPase, partial [Actinomycetota bacterium]|nr:AAA family ATPase [Actinomycetota bacterium]
GGEPGVGKSTLLLQAAASLAGQGRRVLLASAEESVQQLGLRAQRVGIVGEGVYLLAEPDVDAVLAAARELRPDLLVVDSVQTLTASELGSSPGGVVQVRECAGRVIRFAKEHGTATVLVGHVTKDGGIAGPKLLEHVVDVVLYLEGELEHGLRVLRGLKNRFGPTHAVGLFEMQGEGLVQVPDPSAMLLGDWRGSVAGTVVFPAVEGRRPVLVEVQALVSSSSTHQPRRSVKGLEPARIHQLLAVLERHARLPFSNLEVYVSVVGGVRVREPAADLPIALALASSLLDRPLGAAGAWGEVGLTGEVRPVPHEARRREEAARLGLERVVASGRGGVARIDQALAEAGLMGVPDGECRIGAA